MADYGVNDIQDSTVVKIAFGAKTVYPSDAFNVLNLDNLLSKSKAKKYVNENKNKLKRMQIQQHATAVYTKINNAIKEGKSTTTYELTDDQMKDINIRRAVYAVMCVIDDEQQAVDASHTYIKNDKYDPNTDPDTKRYQLLNKTDSQLFGFDVTARKKNSEGKYNDKDKNTEVAIKDWEQFAQKYTISWK
jgi:hypothetical protein